MSVCAACGHAGKDVQVKLVEIEDPPMEVVAHTVNQPHYRDGTPASQPEIAHLTVPKRYGSEPRCTDTRACARRVAEAQPEEVTEEALFR